MSSKVTYYQQYSFCGKPQCKKCREGRGHGPYWYAYRSEGGRTTRTYIGRTLPQEALAAAEETLASSGGDLPAPPPRRLYLLGTFRLERPEAAGQPEESAGRSGLQPAGRALLALLICSPQRRLTRAEACSTLWPNLQPALAARRLERAIQGLRHWLLLTHERETPVRTPLIESEDFLSLPEQDTFWVDADEFERLVAEASSSERDPRREQTLAAALRLYKGDLLSGWNIPTHLAQITSRREALRAHWRQALLTLASLRIQHRQFKSALNLAERLLSSEGENQEALALVLFCLANLKRRSEALRLYQQFLQTSGQPPTSELQTLHEAIRQNQSLSLPLLIHTLPPRQNEESDPGDGPSPLPQPAIGRTHRSPLVGREQELGILRQMLVSSERLAEERLLTSTATGAGNGRPGSTRTTTTLPFDNQRHPQYVVLLAAPGLGKTRLAEEISREAVQRRWTVIWSRVYEQESTIPYRLWIEPLRTIISHERWQQQELRQHPTLYAPLSAILPELYESLPRPSALSPEHEQQRLKEALQELFLRLSSQAPLLLVLDDLQWADASSCELLGYLVRRLAGQPVMFLGTCRDSDLAANTTLQTLIAHLHREHSVITLDLPPLTEEQIAQIVSHVPQPARHYIQTHAAGNPFFAEELARSLEVQLLTPSSQERGEASLQRLPETIAAVLDMRIQRLSRNCRRLLSDAAILGGAFEFEVICALEAAGPQPFDEEHVLDLLDEALQAGVLTEAGGGLRISYHFWHPLLVSHLYESMSAMKRVLLHRRAAETLRRLYASREEKGAATITYHLVAGGAEPEPIIHYAALAAEAAYALSAYTEATRLYRIAVEQLEVLESLPGEASYAELPYDRRANLLGRYAECIRIQGHYREACRFYERALEVARRGERLNQVSDRHYQAQLEARLLTEIGRTWFYMSDFARAHAYCDRAEAILSRAGLSEGMAWAMLRYLRGYIYNDEGSYDEARAEGQEALRLFERLHAHQRRAAGDSQGGPRAADPLISGDPIGLARTHRFLSTLETNMGHYQEALRHLQIALRVAEELGHKREIAHICCNLGHVHLALAEHGEAHTYCQRSLNLADEVGDLPLMAVVFSNLGLLAERQGALTTAEQHLQRAIAQGEQGKDQVYLSYWNTHLSSVLQGRGLLHSAGLALHSALKIARNIKSSPCISSALVALGRQRITQARVLQCVLLQTQQERAQRPTSPPLNEDARLQLARAFQLLLQRAQTSVRLALAQTGITADMRACGELELARAALLLGEPARARLQALNALTQARQMELHWLEAQALAVLGMAEVQNQANPDPLTTARRHFEEALQTFRTRVMPLEYARTLTLYAQTLLQAAPREQHARIKSHLREAEQIFQECGAALDLALLPTPSGP